MEASEARAEEIRSEGFRVDVHSDRKANPRVLGEDPPDAFLIDLGRAPSQGRELGGWLRRNRSTRRVPLVFIGGDPEKTKKARDLLPDATFTTWDDAAADLDRAIVAPPTDPVVPGAMDAYAGAPLVKKLGIREGDRVGLLEAPSGFEALLNGLPPRASVERGLIGRSDVLLLFVRSQDELEKAFPSVAAGLADGGRLWICWPKKASRIASDLSQKAIRAFGLSREFVDYKISSIDRTWSALCFARRGASRV
jgi:CheY-like chemotaxis protein